MILHRYQKFLATVGLGVGSLIGNATTASAQKAVTAIDILLEPYATMIQHAQTANARLLQNFPKGLTLGGEHAPHVSVLQRYVYTDDLDNVYQAAAKVLA